MEETGEEARVTDVAAHLNISKPSVNKAMNILKTKGLINHEHYGNVGLSDEGLEIARNVARRHVIIKAFLKEVLGSDEKTADEEACLIEHSVSTDTVNRLERLVNDYAKSNG